jgi:hypothetical protein
LFGLLLGDRHMDKSYLVEQNRNPANVFQSPILGVHNKTR